jgi:molecular chaperone GrpE
VSKERDLKWAKEAAEKMAEEAETVEEVQEEAAEEAAEEVSEETAETEQAPEEEIPAPEAAVDKELLEAREKYQRLFAEFDNYRKRTEKEKSARYDMGAKQMVEKILPVLDNFELALKNVPEEEKDSSFVEGMDKIHKLFLKTLEDAGVKPIEAEGCEFNPDFHNAVMHVEDDTVGENIVVQELQKGYMYKDSVVRYSMVKVAN